MKTFRSILVIICAYTLVAIFLLPQFISVISAQSCASYGNCLPSGSAKSCSGSGEDCDDSTDCDVGETCNSSPWCDTSKPKSPSCTLSGNSCSGGCPSGTCVYGGCQYFPPPPVNRCGTGPACSSPQICCSGTCRDQCEGTEIPDPDPPLTGSCTADAECPGGCCDPFNHTCTYNCGGAPCNNDLNIGMSMISVRFIKRNGDGTFTALKGTSGPQPINFRIGIKDNQPSSTFSIFNASIYPESSGYADLLNGVPKTYQAYYSGPVKTFDWSKNEINPELDAYMFTVDAGTTDPIANKCGVVDTPLWGPTVAASWSIHMCARGIAKYESEDGIPAPECDLACEGCSKGECRCWCASDVDGCADPSATWQANDWQIERPEEPPKSGGEKTNYGHHSDLNGILKNGFKNNGLLEEARYDGYFTFNARVYNKIYKRRDIKNILVYTPPAGYSCGTIASYGADGSPIEWPILDVQTKMDYGVDVDKCAIEFNGKKLGGMAVAVITLDKSYYNQCYVSIDGKQELVVNTNEESFKKDSSAVIDMSVLSNEDRAVNNGDTLGGTARLIFQKEGSVDYTKPTLFYGSSWNQFSPYNNLTSFYSLYNTVVRSTNGSVASFNTYGLSGPALGFGWGFFNAESYLYEKMPDGTYYAHCDMPYGPEKCSGNPRCDYEGGDINCTERGWQSCAEGATGYIEEVAVSQNRMKYRKLPVNEQGQVTSYGNWIDGPFTFNLPHITTNGGAHVTSIAMYDAVDSLGKKNLYLTAGLYYPNTYPYIHHANDLHFLFMHFIIPYVNGFPDWKKGMEASTTMSYLNNYGFPAEGEVTAHSLLYNPLQNNLLESIWMRTATADELVRPASLPTNNDTIKGYTRTVSLSTAGTPDYISGAGTWSAPISGDALSSTSMVGQPVINQGLVLIPLATGNYAFRNGYGRLNANGTYAQYRNESNPTTPWTSDQALIQMLPSGNQMVGWDNGDPTYLNQIFDGDVVDAYDAHFIPTGISDKAKITFTCLPSCTICSMYGDADGCGGTCTAGAYSGNSLVTNLIVSPMSPAPANGQLLVSWDGNPAAQKYELVAFPILDSTSIDVTQSVTDAYNARTNPSAVFYREIDPNVTNLSLNLFSDPFINKSPKLRVAIRAVNVCNTTEWTIGDSANTETPENPNDVVPGGGGTTDDTSPLSSSLTFTIAELDQTETNACIPIKPLKKIELTENLAITVNNTVTSGPFAGFPLGGAPSITFTSTTEPEIYTRTVLEPLWYSPQEWLYPTAGLYNLSIRQTDLNNNNYGLACESNLRGLYSPTPAGAEAKIYLRRTFDPWFQVKGGVIAAAGGNITSKIPKTCSLPACEPTLLDILPSLSIYSAGLPIASGSIVTQHDATYATYFSKNADTRAATVGTGMNPGISFESLTSLIHDSISGATISSSAKIDNEIITQIPKENTVTIDGTSYAYYTRKNDLTINLSSSQDIGDHKVILLVDGNVTLKSASSPLASAIAVTSESGGFFLLAASGSITFENSLGTAPTVDGSSLTIQPTTRPTVEGIFLADGTLTIASDDPSKADNQFVGKGSFIGLTNVQLTRNFEGSITGSETDPDVRYLNNTYPTEIFIHDPALILNTPAFLLKPLLNFQEVITEE